MNGKTSFRCCAAALLSTLLLWSGGALGQTSAEFAEEPPPPEEPASPTLEASSASGEGVDTPQAPPTAQADAPPAVVPPPPAGSSAAQEEPPALGTAPSSSPCEPVEADHGAIFRAFGQYARNARLQRMIGGASGLVAGGTLLGIGIVGKDIDDPLADVWLVMGGVTAGLSVLSFVLPSPPEGIAKQHGVGTVASPTEEQAASLDKAWKAHANKAREQRIRGGIASIVIAGAAIGFGTAMATGSFDFSSDSERTVVSALLIGGGAAAAIGAVGSLVLPSAAERSFAAYRAAAGAQVAATERPFRVAVSGAPAGLGLGLDGSF